MSLHNKPQSTALVEALIFHGLPYDTPSQLADAFRHGFNYQEARVLELSSKLDALNIGVEDAAKKIAIEVAKNCETVPQLVFPHLYLGLKEFLASSIVMSAEEVPAHSVQCMPATAAMFSGEDHVSVPRGLIGAACSAIEKKRDGMKTLAELRRYTVGDLSVACTGNGDT